jgi:biopolymer transport protein TolR
MSMAVGPNQGVKNEINVTPLVDVVLVLLIIFMVVTPLLQRGKGVVLPRAHKTEEKKEGPDPLIVSITPDKRVYVEQDSTEGPELERRLKRELEAAPGRAILLKGDSKLAYTDVRKVMETARKAGAKGIQLGVEEIKETKEAKK